MKDLLKEEIYGFINSKDKEFIIAFDAEMNRLGYTCNQTIGDGYCWGRKSDRCGLGGQGVLDKSRFFK